MDFLRNMMENLRGRYQALPTVQRLLLLTVIGAGLFAVILLGVLGRSADYGVLFTNLPQDDAGAIVAKLKNKKVAYRLEADGTTIMVPRAEVYEMRLLMASEGIPRGGGVGFELFDRQNLGATEFVQRLNYQRALQGELARTISGIPEISEARVHIVTPKETLFLEDQKQATASVAVKMRSGRTLSRTQVDGIVHLVASAVPGLHANQITVLDLNGKILSKPVDANTPEGLSNGQMTLQRQVEESLERKVQSMLDQIVGAKKSFVRVAADLDFQKIDVREETFTPNKELVRSEQKSTERSTRGGEGSGNPESRFELSKGTIAAPAPGKGPPPLTPPTTPKAAGGGQETERQTELRNYEINRVLRQVVDQPGKIKRISLAVVVDGTYKGKGNVYAARSPEELKQLSNLAKKAVGFSVDRGDQLEISSAPLASQLPEGAVAVGPAGGWQESLSDSLKIGLLVLLVLGVLMILLKKRRAAPQPALLEGPPARALPSAHMPQHAALPTEALAPVQLQAPKPQVTLPDAIDGQDKVAQLITTYPDRAVEVLRLWLHSQER
ncbi:MAG: flagellar M-ring protein FliF [Deltaproteobacteria bacterium RBG_13_58_19]|nr:MAG: flagellar M-ring protein FliF [Deltaproteobacteria bacterium RBG_13_58_19]